MGVTIRVAGVERSEPPEYPSPGGSTLVPRVSTPATQSEFGTTEVILLPPIILLHPSQQNDGGQNNQETDFGQAICNRR